MDMLRKSYASIPCVLNAWQDRELITNRRSNPHDPNVPLILQPYASRSTMAVARRLNQKQGWRPDPTCKRRGGFNQRVRLLEKVFGYKSRWDENPNWRW